MTAEELGRALRRYPGDGYQDQDCLHPGAAELSPKLPRADLEWTALFVGFGLAHLLAAYGLRAWRGWAIVLAAVLAPLGLLVLGYAARSVIMLTADAGGYFDIETVSFWRFQGWEVVGIFGLLVLADAVVLVAVAWHVLGRLRSAVMTDSGSA